VYKQTLKSLLSPNLQVTIIIVTYYDYHILICLNLFTRLLSAIFSQFVHKQVQGICLYHSPKPTVRKQIIINIARLKKKLL